MRDAIAVLDYHPDEVARSLNTGNTNVIGAVIPDITNAFFPELIRGIEEAARRAGYDVFQCDSNEDAQSEAANLAVLSARRVDGVLLACCASSKAFDALIRRRFAGRIRLATAIVASRSQVHRCLLRELRLATA